MKRKKKIFAAVFLSPLLFFAQPYFYPDSATKREKKIKSATEIYRNLSAKGEVISEWEEYRTEYDPLTTNITKTTFRGSSPVNYKYNSKGNLELKSFSYGGFASSEEKCFYNGDGTLHEEISYKVDSYLEETSRRVYFYKNKRLSHYKFLGSDGKVFSYAVYRYDSIGNKIRVMYYDKDSLPENGYGYEYDSKGRVVKNMILDKNGKAFSWKTFQFNAAGKNCFTKYFYDTICYRIIRTAYNAENIPMYSIDSLMGFANSIVYTFSNGLLTKKRCKYMEATGKARGYRFVYFDDKHREKMCLIVNEDREISYVVKTKYYDELNASVRIGFNSNGNESKGRPDSVVWEKGGRKKHLYEFGYGAGQMRKEVISSYNKEGKKTKEKILDYLVPDGGGCIPHYKYVSRPAKKTETNSEEFDDRPITDRGRRIIQEDARMRVLIEDGGITNEEYEYQYEFAP